MKVKNIFVGIAVFMLSSFWASMAMADMSDERKPDDSIFFAEFDGEDDTSLWAKFNVGGSFQNYSTVGKIENGFLSTEPGNTAFGRWGVYFGTGNDAYRVPVTNNNINLEIKFKVEGKIADTTIWQMNGRRVEYSENDNIDFADMYIKNGKIGCGDRTGVTADTGITVELGKWYIIKSRISFADRKVYTDIIDEEGTVKSYTSSFTWEIAFENITQFTLHKNDASGVKYVTDYVCLWDDSFGVKEISIKDGEDNVRIDTDIDIKFSDLPKTESLENITIVDEIGELIDAEITLNGKTANVYFPLGLRYNKTYTLSVPKSVVNENGDAAAEKSITFTTEQKSFIIGEIKENVTTNKVEANVTVKNGTMQDKILYLLIMAYDEDGTLIKMDNIRGEALKGSETVISGEIDVTGLNVSDVKTYVWNGVNVE